jgi:hypothetical protein
LTQVIILGNHRQKRCKKTAFAPSSTSARSSSGRLYGPVALRRSSHGIILRQSLIHSTVSHVWTVRRDDKILSLNFLSSIRVAILLSSPSSSLLTSSVFFASLILFSGEEDAVVEGITFVFPLGIALWQVRCSSSCSVVTELSASITVFDGSPLILMGCGVLPPLLVDLRGKVVENAVVAERLTITKNTKCQRTLGRRRVGALDTTVGLLAFGRKEQEETENGAAVSTTTPHPPPGLMLLFDGLS